MMNYGGLINALLDPPICKIIKKKCPKESISQPHNYIHEEDTAEPTEPESEHLVPDYLKLTKNNPYRKLPAYESSAHVSNERDHFDLQNDESFLMPADFKDEVVADKNDEVCLACNGEFVFGSEEVILSQIHSEGGNEIFHGELKIMHASAKTEMHVCKEKIEVSTYNNQLEESRISENNLHKILTPENLELSSQIPCIQDIHEITCQLLEEIISVVLQEQPNVGLLQKSLNIGESRINNISAVKLISTHKNSSYCAVKESHNLTDEENEFFTNNSQGKDVSPKNNSFVCCPRNVGNYSNLPEETVPAKTKEESSLQTSLNENPPLKSDGTNSFQTVDLTTEPLSIDITPEIIRLLNDLVNNVPTTPPEMYHSTSTLISDNFSSHAVEEIKHSDKNFTSTGVISDFAAEINTPKHCREENELCMLPTNKRPKIHVFSSLGDPNKDSINFASNFNNSEETKHQLLSSAVYSDIAVNLSSESEHMENSASNNCVTLTDKALHFDDQKPSTPITQEKINEIQSQELQTNMCEVCTARSNSFSNYGNKCTSEKENLLCQTSDLNLYNSSANNLESYTSDCLGTKFSISQPSVLNVDDLNAYFIEANRLSEECMDIVEKGTTGTNDIKCLDSVGRVCTNFLATEEFNEMNNQTATELILKDIKMSSIKLSSPKETLQKNIVLSSVALMVTDDCVSLKSSKDSSLLSSPSVMEKPHGGSSIISFLYPSPEIVSSPSIPSSTEENVRKKEKLTIHTLVNYSLTSSLCCSDIDSDDCYDYDGDLSDYSVDGTCFVGSINSSQDSLDVYIDKAVNKYSERFQKCSKIADEQILLKSHQCHDSLVQTIENCKRSMQPGSPDASSAKRAKLQIENIKHNVMSSSIKETDINYYVRDEFSIHELQKCKQNAADSVEKEVPNLAIGFSCREPQNKKAKFECEKNYSNGVSENLIHQKPEACRDCSIYHKCEKMTECHKTVLDCDENIISKMLDSKNMQENVTVCLEDFNVCEANAKNDNLKKIKFYLLNGQEDITARLDSMQICSTDLETVHPDIAAAKTSLLHETSTASAQIGAFNWKSETNMKPKLTELSQSHVSTVTTKPSIRVGMSKRAKVIPLHSRI
ncbi:uncharacterized protein LOC134541632 [Bacillus rossius redtenbacheri]|uniref:uncharacterized protein LOC134541632 n=1 Tax=Bacillus rossius redtenbacheri TaxID=93214 RepID=UPI002FDD8658